MIITDRWTSHVVAAPPSGVAELPRQYVDSAIDPSYDRPPDFHVAGGQNLQAVIDQAPPGSIIEVEAGASFWMQHTLRNKPGQAFTYIRSTRWRELPPPGHRVGPQHAGLMPKIRSVSVNTPSLICDHGAHHYRLIGVEVLSDKTDGALVDLGTGNSNTNPSSSLGTRGWP